MCLDLRNSDLGTHFEKGMDLLSNLVQELFLVLVPPPLRYVDNNTCLPCRIVEILAIR